MQKLAVIVILSISFLICLNVNSDLIEIKVQIKDELITNIDIKDEINYLTFLNPKLKNLDEIKILNISKNSLVNEIIKRNELKKFIDIEKENNLANIVERNLMLKKNIKNKKEFKEILISRDLNYGKVKKKMLIEALWNQYIYKKYSKNLVINKSELRNKIKSQIENIKKKYEYNLSEIVFKEEIELNIENKIEKIKDSIKNIGFENTANIYSISNTAKNGGSIGWINELQISQQIIEKIEQLKELQISEPIKINNSYIIIKINKKKELKNKIEVEKELEKLIQLETNRQLNNFSIIFFKRLKKNLEINEY